MTSMSFPTRSTFAFALALGLAVTACENGESPTENEGSDQSDLVESSEESSLSLRMAYALRQLDVGQEIAVSKETLKEVAEDPAATPQERGEAQLGVSRALELEGDLEGAIELVEAVIATPNEDRGSKVSEAASKRLRKLITGTDDTLGGAPRPDVPVPPVAMAFAEFFPLAEEGTTRVNVLQFGGSSISDRLGTYNIRSAVRDVREKTCPLCDTNISLSISRSHSGSWTAIPHHIGADAEPAMSEALVVFYVDLGDNLVPSRYDEYLAMPSEKIAEHLESGDGLIAVRRRPSAPPVLVIAAPRVGQFSLVEEALAEMRHLPEEPVTIELNKALLPTEIQSVVRSARGKQRACYHALLERTPAAEGNVTVGFTIEGDGSVHAAQVNDENTTIEDAALRSCMLDVFSGMKFPSTGESTSVNYPIAMTPGD